MNHLRERVAVFPHQEGPVAGNEERLSRMPAGAAQDRGQGGGHLRQRHDDDCGRERGSKKELRPFIGFNPIEFDGIE